MVTPIYKGNEDINVRAVKGAMPQTITIHDRTNK